MNPKEEEGGGGGGGAHQAVLRRTRGTPSLQVTELEVLGSRPECKREREAQVGGRLQCDDRL